MLDSLFNRPSVAGAVLQTALSLKGSIHKKVFWVQKMRVSETSSWSDLPDVPLAGNSKQHIITNQGMLTVSRPKHTFL